MSDPTEGSPPPVAPAADPAAQAAADVTRLLASAFGLRRAVQLAEQSRRDHRGDRPAAAAPIDDDDGT